MIDRAEILAFATDLGLSPEVVEKDYALGWLLAGIYAQPALAENWVFKGGTCLKKCFFETYRFSEDLDFTLVDATQLDRDFLQGSFHDVAAWVYEQTGIQIPTDQLRFDIYTNPRGGVSCQGRIYYIGPLPHPGALPRIKLDLTADELLALPATDRPVGHPYSDLPEKGMTARCYAYEEVFGEKIRALGERARPRDLYDVINLFRHGEFRPAAATILDVLRRKCEFKQIPLPSAAGLNARAQELATDWQNMLGHQLPVLPPFDSFWGVLPEFFAWLTGTVSTAAVPVVVAPISVGADEQLFRPPVGLLRRQGIANSSFIESIRFAGANRLRVDLGYQNSVRRIEPYALRRSQVGNILVYAVKSETGEVRGYRLDRMQSVRITNETFVPRYAIELTAGETGTIPPVSTSSVRSSYRSSPRPSRRSSGPVYIYQCPICQKRFRHEKRNSHLGPHKSEQGWRCSGRTGYLVDTR